MNWAEKRETIKAQGVSVSHSDMAAARFESAHGMNEIYAFKLKGYWSAFWSEHFSFWMICAYLFFEYVRPQSIIPAIDILPWATVFLLLSLVGLLSDPNRKWVRESSNVWMTIFLLLICASSLLATFPDDSWPHFKDFFGWYVIYFLIINIVTSERRYLVFLGIFLLASFKLSLFGARAWAGRGFAFTLWGIQGPPGFFQNSGELAIQMLMFSPVVYELVMFARPRISLLKFCLLQLMPLTGAMTVLGASSRGGQIGLVVQGYLTFLKGKLNIRTLVIIGTLAFAGFTLLPAEQKARFSAVGEDRTSQQRLLYWKRGAEMIHDHPVFGVGYFNFPRCFATYYPQDMLYGAAQLPHNIFVQVGTDLGVLGLAVFLILVMRTFRLNRATRRLAAADVKRLPFAHLSRGLDAALWGYLVAGQFVSVAYYPFFWINLALSVALKNVTERHYQAAAALAAAAPAGNTPDKARSVLTAQRRGQRLGTS